jgi:hypothetical protein
MAGELGFEPRFSESESDVLPLNYSPTGLGRLSSLPDGSDMGQFGQFYKCERPDPVRRGVGVALRP